MASARIAPHSGNPGLPEPFFSFDGREDGPSFFHVIEDKVSIRLGSPTPTQLTISAPTKLNKSGEDEIGIFAAERYFNGGMDAVVSENSSTVKPEASTPKKLHSPCRKERGRGVPRSAGTPSTCSEMSGNSRSSLLRAAHREPPVSPRRGKLLADVLCKCACTGKRSIEVESDNVGSNSPGRIANQISGRPDFRFSDETGRVNLNRITIGLKGEGGRRFGGSPHLSRGNSTVARELKGEKMAGILLPSPPGPGGFVGSPPIHESLGLSTTDIRKSLARFSFGRGGNGSGSDGDDALSEASSELFEIESFSTSRASYLKDTSSAISAYEPSEASIEWSVVTASAANASVATDYAGEWGEEAPPNTKKSHTKAPHKPHHHRRQRSSSLLMSCASSKAVDISSNTCRLPEKRENCRAGAARTGGTTAAVRCSVRASPLVDHAVKPTVTEGGGQAWAARSIAPARVPHPRYSRDRSASSRTLVNRNSFYMGNSRLSSQQHVVQL